MNLYKVLKRIQSSSDPTRTFTVGSCVKESDIEGDVAQLLRDGWIVPFNVNTTPVNPMPWDPGVAREVQLKICAVRRDAEETAIETIDRLVEVGGQTGGGGSVEETEKLVKEIERLKAKNAKLVEKIAKLTGGGGAS